MKRIVAGALTVVLMGTLLWAGSRRPTPPGAQPGNEDPVRVTGSNAWVTHPAEERVRGLLGSAVEGDVTGYLGAFTGTLRGRLDREVTERGREAFADDLRGAAKSRKSHAV